MSFSALSSCSPGANSPSARNAYSKLLSMNARLSALEEAVEERVRPRAVMASKDAWRETQILAAREAQEDAWLDAPLDPGEGYWSLASQDSVLAALGHVPSPPSSSDDATTVSTAATSVCSTLPSSPTNSPRANPRSTFDSDLLASLCVPFSPERRSLVFPLSPLLVPIPLPRRLEVPEEDRTPVASTLESSRVGVPVSFERVACGA